MAGRRRRGTFLTELDMDSEKNPATLIDENHGYDYVRRTSGANILSLQGYHYLLDNYKTSSNGYVVKVSKDAMQNSIPNDTARKSSYQDGSSSTNSSPVTTRRSKAVSECAHPQRPRTVKQQKNKKLQRQLEREMLKNERWRCPSESVANVSWSEANVTVIPLEYDERAVDCEGLDEKSEKKRHAMNQSISPMSSISTAFDESIIHEKSKQKRSKFPTISRILHRRPRSKSANYTDSLKLAISETDLSRWSPSDRYTNQPDHYTNRPDHYTNQLEPTQRYRPKSEYDLPMIASKSVDKVTLLGRPSPSVAMPKTQNDEFRKKFVKGLWSANLAKGDRKNIELMIDPVPACKSSDSGYDSPETAPKKSSMGDAVERPVAKRSYEHFDLRKASLFNDYFAKNEENQAITDIDEQVYTQIDSIQGDQSVAQAKVHLDARNASNSGNENDRAMQSKQICKLDELPELPTKNVNGEERANMDKYNAYATLPGTAMQELSDGVDCPIVVAIDFGTAYSGYAYAIRQKQDDRIYLMRRLNTSDPGASSPKCPTCVLLDPNGKFHSFGWEARDYYHDLEPESARRYLYFENFKLILESEQDLRKHTKVVATNGMLWPAIDVLAHCLRYLKRHAMVELSECTGFMVDPAHIQWVMTVPAIWRQSVKQLMRLAAYQAGIASLSKPNQLLLALEPEAAAMYCKQLKANDILPRIAASKTYFSLPSSLKKSVINRDKMYKAEFQSIRLEPGSAFMVVDCGGGIVDVTVHQLDKNGRLVEMHKATGGPHGSNEIDQAFESLLCDIFGADFMNQFRLRYPAAYIDLMQSFETRKRAAHPYKSNPFNVALPFSFLEYYRKTFGHRVECAVKRHERKQHVSWNSQGMLRISAEMMTYLFMPTLVAIIKLIDNALEAVQSVKISYLFLVGGFAESPLLQHEIRNAFENRVKAVIIPNHTSTAVLQGSVLFGLYPHEICIRRSRTTYGISVLHPFDPQSHPLEKRVSKNARDWCKDVFEKFITVNEPIDCDEEMIRHYCPASMDQTQILIQIYCTEAADPQFVTDPSVKRCAVLRIDLPKDSENGNQNDSIRDKEIKTSMKFGHTELILTAIDIRSGQPVNGQIDFLGY